MLDLHPATAGVASARFTLHYLEDTAVLFDAAAQRLYELNATAAYIWTYLEQRVPASVIVGNLCATFGFPREAAETHVRSVLASRQRLSVVAASLAGAEPARTAAVAPVRGPWQSALTLRLLDQTVHLRCGPSVPGGELARAFSLLCTGAGDGDAIAFDLTCRGDRFHLRVDGAVTDRCWRADQVLPMVKARMVEVVLARSGDLFAVHAAAVGRGRSCVLIPGPSGSGKSTLAAALSADGFRLLGDDTVVLARESLAARPMALPICLKDGSWRLLAPRYPELESLGINVRGDGKRARYLLPPKRDRARSRRVTAIVFPCRTASLKGGLVPLAKPEALTRLMGGLCPLGAELDARTVERFVRWIEEIDCRELRYGTLDEGVDRIGELCR